MKKLFLFTWMMMLSIVAMAQTIMVIDKDGNRIPYDPEKVSSVDFQVTPQCGLSGLTSGIHGEP